MTIEIRPFDELGTFRTDWLDARHHFSFGEYHDRSRMGVGPLRVWNDDRIQPGTGFDPHPHRDMEIITYVRRGAITHRDNLGNEGRTVAGDVQVMSAGTGIVHAEYNLEDDVTELFQIWIRPDQGGHTPRWETRAFPRGERAGRLVPLASGEAGFADALPIHRNATVYGATLAAGHATTHTLGEGRSAYAVAARGAVTINGTAVNDRSGVLIGGAGDITFEATEDAEIVLVDVPAD